MNRPLIISRALFWRLVTAHYLTTAHREGLFFAALGDIELATTQEATEAAA